MLPHELAAKHLIPHMKALVARRLRDKGFGQERIARLLGVSQPMVSRYLRRSCEELLAALAEAGVDGDEAVSMAETLASQLARGDVEAYYRLFTGFVNAVLARGGLCGLHRSRYGAPAGCNICLSLFRAGEDPVVREVEEAARLFASTPGA